MNDWLIAAGYIVAWLLGIWVGWYGLRPPQLRWPWHYSEADAYAKKYCSDELALARASEEAWQQARESDGRAKSMLFGIPVKFDPTTPKNEIRVEAATPSTDSLPDTETPAEQGSTKTLSYSELFPASQGGTPKP